MIVTALSEESVMNNSVDIQLVEKRITVLLTVSPLILSRIMTNLGDTGSKHYHFIKFTNSLHELINARSFYDVDIVILTLNLHGYRKVCLMQNLNC
jgi:hypothetical protein